MTSRFTVAFHPGAADEVQAAERWYRERNEAAAARFRAEIDRAIEAISAAPERWASYDLNTRRFILRRFPFLVIYRQSGQQLEIVAVAHARRLPGYWRQR